MKTIPNENELVKPKKKKSKKAMDVDNSPEVVQVSTYKVPNMGPYPQDIPKKNTVPFTPIQGNLFFLIKK